MHAAIYRTHPEEDESSEIVDFIVSPPETLFFRDELWLGELKEHLAQAFPHLNIGIDTCSALRNSDDEVAVIPIAGTIGEHSGYLKPVTEETENTMRLIVEAVKDYTRSLTRPKLS